ncbi:MULTISPECIES: hypothetical protein [Enterococcus]|uniref:hypothetical protein n=1 Tax=Enterococcus TaxID=1350 RepID=UPI000CF05190|nr:hypothetical protein [Enterococcus faecium]EGP5667549.1 hypothetical protein [Enterococcus faecium]MCE3186521.1 hypothetical protein [Enterococcus faecium]MCU2174177.1 hypothetical protein [Enterococcus faecium]MDQ8487308.1 hypothetical protein [Enterococcus faecium]NTP74549.1 hypothetical protein [Enterococcus faecium]
MTPEYKEMIKELEITENQEKKLFDFLDDSREKVASGNRVAAITYEQNFYLITNDVDRHHHAPEYFLFECAKEGRYSDLYIHFYEGIAKHDQRIKQYGFQ